MSIAASTLMIVSGLSGSGKSVALKTFEDLDYYCSDNLPVELLPDFVRSRLRATRSATSAWQWASMCAAAAT